jgi:hypothetical protein
MSNQKKEAQQRLLDRIFNPKEKRKWKKVKVVTTRVVGLEILRWTHEEWDLVKGKL